MLSFSAEHKGPQNSETTGMGQHNVADGQDDARALAFQQALLKDLSVLEHLCETSALEEGVGRVAAE